MPITGKQINTVDLGVGGTAAAPTKTYTGIIVVAFEPSFDPLGEPRVDSGGGVDVVASPTQLFWDIEFLLTQYPDTTTGVTAMEKVLAFFANRPQFVRGNSAEWIARHANTTTWIPVVTLGDLPATRKTNYYGLKFRVQECAAITISAP